MREVVQGFGAEIGRIARRYRRRRWWGNCRGVRRWVHGSDVIKDGASDHPKVSGPDEPDTWMIANIRSSGRVNSPALAPLGIREQEITEELPCENNVRDSGRTRDPLSPFEAFLQSFVAGEMGDTGKVENAIQKK